MSRIQSLPKDKRPREKMLQKGVRSLSDKELLAVVLGKGTAQKDVLTLSQELIERIQDSEVELTIQELLKVKGIGVMKACQVLASIEFSRRYLTAKQAVCIRKPEDAIPMLVSLKIAQQEELAVLTLDGAHQVIGVHFVTKGLVNRNQVHPREVFRPAIRDNAVGILVAHNHPSGTLKASKSDLKVTERLSEVGETIGIPLLDHLIVTKRGHLSLRDNHPSYFGS